jgi:tetratricopeptide (TPR) repeat protein
MRHWRRVRQLTDELGDSPEADALAIEARTGILHLAWQLGMSPEEIAAIGVETGAGVEGVGLDPHYAGFVMHNAREREGLEAFQAIYRHAIETGDPGRAVVAATGVAYSSWIAGSLQEGAETMEHAIRLADRDPKLAAGEPFICALAHAFGSRALSRGYMGEVEAARRDFEHGAELAREYDDAQTHCHNRGNLALLEASAGEIEAALRHAALGLEIAEQMGDVIGIIASTTPTAVANADAGRFAEALEQAESTLATIGDRQIGRYFEPLLLATIARAKLGLGEPDEALAAAEQAVAIMDARRLTACALRAPITLAHVLMATEGAAAGERIESVLAQAQRVVDASGARIFEAPIQAELAALARLGGDVAA